MDSLFHVCRCRTEEFQGNQSNFVGIDSFWKWTTSKPKSFDPWNLSVHHVYHILNIPSKYGLLSWGVRLHTISPTAHCSDSACRVCIFVKYVTLKVLVRYFGEVYLAESKYCIKTLNALRKIYAKYFPLPKLTLTECKYLYNIVTTVKYLTLNFEKINYA